MDPDTRIDRIDAEITKAFVGYDVVLNVHLVNGFSLGPEIYRWRPWRRWAKRTAATLARREFRRERTQPQPLTLTFTPTED